MVSFCGFFSFNGLTTHRTLYKFTSYTRDEKLDLHSVKCLVKGAIKSAFVTALHAFDAHQILSLRLPLQGASQVVEAVFTTVLHPTFDKRQRCYLTTLCYPHKGVVKDVSASIQRLGKSVVKDV